MTPGRISRRVVADRLALLHALLGQIRSLPLHDRDAFFADARNPLAAESCLRRGLEALLDLGRHVLAKGFGVGVSEYREIAEELGRRGVLDGPEAALLRTLAGYRNRLVHFYHEVAAEEVYALCAGKLADLERLGLAYRQWLQAHPDQVDETL